MTSERNAELLQRYRRIALWGGGVSIGGASAIGAGSHFALLSFQYFAIIAGGIAFGALIGYFFFELIIARLVAGPSASDSRTGGGGGWFGGTSDVGSSGGGDGGDGGGGGGD